MPEPVGDESLRDLSGVNAWRVRVLGVVAPLTAAMLALAVVVFVVFRRWLTLPVAIAAVLALCFTQLPLWVGQSPPAGERFTVLTANLLFGGADVDDALRGHVFAVQDALFWMAFIVAITASAAVIPDDGKSSALMAAGSVVYGGKGISAALAIYNIVTSSAPVAGVSSLIRLAA